MTLTNVIIPDVMGSSCPICGYPVLDAADIFARCRQCGCEVTFLRTCGPAPEVKRG